MMRSATILWAGGLRGGGSGADAQARDLREVGRHVDVAAQMGQVEVEPAKVAVGRRLAVDGFTQVEGLDDRRGAEVKHPLHRALNRLVV